MMSETPDETEIEDKMIISESRRSSPKRSPNCTSMKMLITQEMSKETGSKDGPPNVVAKLMGLDALPSRQHSLDPLKSKLKGYARHYEKSASTWTEEQTYLERQMRNKDCRMQKKNDCKDVYEVQRISRGPDSIKGISTPRGRNDETIRDDKMAFVRQKFLEAKRLATNEKLLKSKEFQDAVDVLSSNSDLFLKLLQEPNIKLSKNLNELQSLCASPAPKRITVLRPSKMVANNRFCSIMVRNEEPVDEPEVLTQEAPCTRSIPANFSPTYIHQNHDRYVSQQPTRIVILKPSFRQSDDSIPVTLAPVVSSSKLIQSDFIHVDEDTDARTSREIAREVTHYTRETILHQRMNESVMSSAIPNGYGISCGSPFKKLDEIQVEAFSDPEVTSPASRRSWDIMNSFDSPLSTSSLSRASYSPDSSVCRKAKKRLSERWAVMASNGKCQEERHLRKSSSTLGEMLALSDSKLLNEKQEHYECKVDEPRMSASCLKTSLSGEEFTESLKCLSRSKSVPLSSTLSGDRMHLRSISSDSCQQDGKESARDKGATSFKGILSNFFSTRNKRITRENSSTFRFANESQLLAAESSAYIVNSVLQSSSTHGKNRQEDNSSSHFQKGAPGKASPIPIDVSLNGSAIAERSPLVGSGANPDQLSPVSVLDPICEDDNGTIADPSGKELTSSSLRYNLIDKSPPIGSISRTLSGNHSRKSEPPYAPKASLMYSCAKEEEQELPVYIRRLLSTIVIGTEDDTNSTDISRWHSPDSPLNPTILNKCPGEEDNEDRQPLHEARKRIRRSNRKLVFDCVNAALLRNVGFGPVGLFKVEDRGIEGGPLIMGDRIWGQIKDWFSSEVSSAGGYDMDGDIMTVDGVGVMEAIRISCAGYPTRRPFFEFVDRFGILAPEVLDRSLEAATICKRLLEKVRVDGYQIGKTKVFLRAGQMAELDAQRTEVLGRSACIIQRKTRSYMARRRFVSLQQSAIALQAACRRQLARESFEILRREAACLIIQKDVRMYSARKGYTDLCSSAITIQTGMRGMASRSDLRLRNQIKASIVIQSYCRMFLARNRYLMLRKAAVITQCAWRGRAARKELRKLKMAARETGALQAAKNILEKQVEELTWRLQLEKRMRADLEEAKTRENAKLQSALSDTQRDLRETKEMLIKEREVSNKAVDVAPIVQEVPVIDDELIEKLTAENEKLKDLVNSLEKKLDDTETKFEETRNISEERLKQAMEAESKIIQLKTDMQRLQEKIEDMESENQILHRQRFVNPSGKNLLIVENGHMMLEESDTNTGTPVKKSDTDSDGKFRKSNVERQQENFDALINCVVKKMGFSHGKPVAAFTIYKCLLHWKSFEADKTSVFDRLIQMIGSAIENEDDNDHMAYWLSNTSSLLYLLQRSLKAAGASNKKPPQPTSLFGRMTMGFRSSSSSASLAATAAAAIRQVEAKYPALLFKQQLTAYVEKIYGIIRDNLKKELGSLLSLCIQAPRAPKGSVLRSGSFGRDSPSTHWQNIIETLNTLLFTLKEYFVPPILAQNIFTQTFSFVNVQLFNSLLLRRECCTFSNGEYVKAGLAELELWCCQAKEEFAGSSWEELKHIRQAVGFLVIHQKYRISYDEITNDLCPIMSVQQLYRLCTLYCDDSYNTKSVAPEVVSSMRVLMTEDSNDDASNSFLLDDNSSIPFSVDELSNVLQEKDFEGVKPAEELLENPAFHFLQDS